MKRQWKNYWLAPLVLGAALGIVGLRTEAHNNSSSAAVIIEWNQLAQKTLIGAPFAQTRMYAMLHVAMGDAVVAIEGRYEPFHVTVRAPRGASAEAAAAQAGHDVLVSFFLPLLSNASTADDEAATAAIASFDAALAAKLATIPPGLKANGVQVGKKVAAEVIAWRANDGFANANPQPPPLLESTLPGIWRQTTPGAAGAAQFAKLGDVEPFGLLSPTQFLPVPMPQLESADYAEDFNEVKAGSRPPLPLSTNAADYTVPQRTALLWAGGLAFGGIATPFVNVTNPFRIWNNVTRDVAQAQSLSLVQTARLFALVTVSLHDGLQTAHTSKFIYRLWRPHTAITAAAADQDDNNPNTPEDATWIPLLTTPPYPSHSSNMTCIGASAARMLANVFRTDAKSFNAVWYKDDSATPQVIYSGPHTSFMALAQDEGNSRIWGGIHFRFEIDASLVACSNVADYLYDHYMQGSGYGRFGY